MMRKRYSGFRPMGQLTPWEYAAVADGWATLYTSWRWLRYDPRWWLRVHARRPDTVLLLLRLLWCCLVVRLFAEPPSDRRP